jgi:hypothetical protein
MFRLLAEFDFEIAIARADADDRNVLRLALFAPAADVLQEEFVRAGKPERLEHRTQVAVRPVMEDVRQFVHVEAVVELSLLVAQAAGVFRVGPGLVGGNRVGGSGNGSGTGPRR